MAQRYDVLIGILLLSAAVCLTSVKATINCNSRIERGNAYEQCFNDRNLHAPDVFKSYRTTHTCNIEGLPFEDIVMSLGDKICTHYSTALKAALSCTHQIDIDCITDSRVKSLMPSSLDMVRTVDPFCEYFEHLNLTCIKQRERVLEGCMEYMSAREVLTLVDIAELGCRVYLIAAECVKKEYKPCGCTSSKVYSDIYMDVLPNFCDETTRAVVCSSTNPNKFVDDGLSGVPRHGMAIGLLAISVLVVEVLA